MKKRLILFSVLALVIFAFSVFAQPKLVITSYCDVRLESCKAQDSALALIEKNYPYDVTVDYLYYFDTENPHSSLAQIAVECANKQGMKEEYKTELQNNLDVLTRSALKQYGENAGLAAANFSFCLDTQLTAWDVLEEVEEAEEDGVTEAPSVRFNHDIYTGSQTYTSLKSLVDEYLGSSIQLSNDMISIPLSNIEIEPEETTEPNHQAYEESESISEELSLPEEGRQELEKIEEPLFFRVIKQIRAWMLGLFQ